MDDTPQDPPPNPGQKPADKPKPVQKPAVKDEPKDDSGDDAPALDWAKAPKTFRAQFDKVSKRVKELESELNAARSGQPSEKDRAAWEEKLTAAEKRAQEREERLQQIDYERSDAYRDSHVKPMEKAFSDAYTAVKSVKVVGPDGEEVQMTESHFNALIRMSDDQAEEAVAQWFGDTGKGVLRANRFLELRRDILRRDEARQEALKNHMSTREQRERQSREASQRTMQQRRDLFQKSIQEGQESHPDLFKPADDDPKGKELMTKGMVISDMAFTAQSVPEDQMPRLHAAIRNKAGAFDYVAYRLRQANKRVAALEKEIEGYKASSPGAGGSRGAGNRPGEMSAEQEIRALASE